MEMESEDAATHRKETYDHWFKDCQGTEEKRASGVQEHNRRVMERVQQCRYNKQNNGANCSGYHEIYESEDELKLAVSNVGPISVAINAMNSFVKYKNGVYYDSDCFSDWFMLNHAVLVVGYGTDPDTRQDYWLVKNSWGTDWGDKGYIKMARNKDNMCGIATFALYPTI